MIAKILLKIDMYLSVCKHVNREIFPFQVKQLYQKIQSQAESLKGLWVAKLNLKGRSALATAEDLQEFERKRDEVLYAMQEIMLLFAPPH